MRLCFAVVAFLFTVNAFGSTSDLCRSLTEKRDLAAFSGPYQAQIKKMLKEKILSDDQLALATVVTARLENTQFGVLIVENLYLDADREPFAYYTLKTGLFRRPVWGYLNLEKPGDYKLSNGQVAHVYNGSHRGVFGTGITHELTVE